MDRENNSIARQDIKGIVTLHPSTDPTSLRGIYTWCILTKAAVNVSEKWQVVELRKLLIWWVRLEEKLMTRKGDARVGRNLMVRVGVSDSPRI